MSNPTNNYSNNNSDAANYKSSNTIRGLGKVNGRGRVNSAAKPKGNTKFVIVGNGTFYGKAAKRALYLKGKREHYEQHSGTGTVGHQRPGSVKTR